MAASRQTRPIAQGAVATLAAALALVLSAAPVAAAEPDAAAGDAAEVLFTFDALIYAASSNATPAELARLRPYLLTYAPDARLDAAYPIRAALAAATRAWPRPLRARALAFLLAHPAAVTNYNALAVTLFGSAPTFVASDDGVAGGALEQDIFAHRAQLQNLLREGYREGNLAALWRAWAPAWRRSQPAPAHVRALGVAVARYLQVAAPVVNADSRVIANPLMPAGTGVTSMFADGHYVMLVGPTAGAREADVLVSHELAHPLLDALLRADQPLRQALADSQCIYAGIRLDPAAGVLTHAVYTTWESYLSESLIRAISHRLGGLRDDGRGFALTHLLAAEMARYERAGAPFDQTVESMLGRLRGAVCRGGAARPLDVRAVDAQRQLFSRL